MGIMIERKKKLLMMQTFGLLPKAYRKIEYLESTGTQYFWTDINIQDGLTVDSVQTFKLQDSYLFGGIANSDTERNRSCFNGAYRLALQGSYPNTYYLKNDTLTFDTIYHIVTEHKDGYVIIYKNDQLIDNRRKGDAIIDSNEKCVCFAARKGDGTIFQYYIGKVYSLIVLKDGALLANYVPCVRVSDNKPGMYDIVGKTFYTNAGAGEFLVPSTNQ